MANTGLAFQALGGNKRRREIRRKIWPPFNERRRNGVQAMVLGPRWEQ